MPKKLTKLIIILFLFVGAFLPVVLVRAESKLADQINSQITAGATKAEFVDAGKATPPQAIVVLAIKLVLQTVGIVFIVLVLYGAYNLITARGDEEKIKKAMGIIRPAVIGLVIILVSYSITSFVSNQILGALSKTGK